jgi:TRAP-type mannitol/chloroaromatic compound transport system permease large subunit
VTRGVMPFLIADLVILGILIAWPEIVLFLPDLM